MKTKTILVTGGAGYIGSAITHLLKEAGHTVVVFDDYSSGQKDKVVAGVDVIEGDVTNLDELDKVFQTNSFDSVIHCAAKKSVSESQENPDLYFRNNLLGTLNILKCMEEHQVPQIIFSSTAAVYGVDETGNTVFTEESLLAPGTVYGQSKLMAENLIKAFADTGKISNYQIFRYFNVAGDTGLCFKEVGAQNVFSLLSSALEQDTDFNIFGTDFETKDGTGVRDYIHLGDLADAHLRALDNDTSDIYNLGTKNGYSVRELIEMFQKLSGKELKVVEVSRRQGDLGTAISDATKAQTKLNWHPTHTLEDMVSSTLKVYTL